MERTRFEAVKKRGILGFTASMLPEWNRILVTGGTGCIGQTVLSNLARDLPEAQLWSLSRRRPATSNTAVTYLQGDIRDVSRIDEVINLVRPELVIHLAAQRDPSYAETHVTETVSTNVLGTQVVLDATGIAGVKTVVVASTGKAVRFFTSDVYAATKKLVEYHAARAAEMYGMAVACTRFTHVVDNSIVARRLEQWIADDAPIELHAPDVLLPVQSALECYHLLMIAGAVARPEPQVVALRDLGWPPIVLLEMAREYLADNPSSRSSIVFTGYPPGYEATFYPGTYDPRSAGDVSPLVNMIEATRTKPSPILGDLVDSFEPMEAVGLGDAVDLRAASEALFNQTLRTAGVDLMTRSFKLGKRYDSSIADHALIHQRIEAFLSKMS